MGNTTRNVAPALGQAWKKSLALANIDKRFTVHGLRYTFTDLTRRANVHRLVPLDPAARAVSAGGSGTNGGTEGSETAKAG